MLDHHRVVVRKRGTYGLEEKAQKANCLDEGTESSEGLVLASMPLSGQVYGTYLSTWPNDIGELG
jgi:hypothetical protein